jgi:protein gp37
MENTKIEWATHTFNPWMGCTKVSPGCANCYAETLMDGRFRRVKWGKGQPRVRTKNWDEPVRWNREKEHEMMEIMRVSPLQGFERPRVFCASLADWLDEEVPIEWFCDLLELVFATPMLDWLLLTKRPENWYERICNANHYLWDTHSKIYEPWLKWISGESPKNVWIGVSAEDQEHWDIRVHDLVRIPARVRFVSAEPLLGYIHAGAAAVDWVIVGGESGPGSRPVKSEWVKSLRNQCQYYQIPFFFKQWGGENKAAAGRELDGQIYRELPINGLKS